MQKQSKISGNRALGVLEHFQEDFTNLSLCKQFTWKRLENVLVHFLIFLGWFAGIFNLQKDFLEVNYLSFLFSETAKLAQQHKAKLWCCRSETFNLCLAWYTIGERTDKSGTRKTQNQVVQGKLIHFSPTYHVPYHLLCSSLLR